MARYFSESEIRPEALHGKRIAMVGYGNQGRPQALNLRDSGLSVVVGVREGGASWSKAKDEGFDVASIEEAAKRADFVMMCVPDTRMAEVYAHSLAPNMTPGACLAFCHGFNIRYDLIEPRQDLDVVLISPKAAGTGVRRLYEEGKGAPALIAVHHDATGSALDLALAYGSGIGAARAFMMETTFKEETETDLFGEQAALCGGIPEIIKASFQTLVEAGYQPEIAYFECLHETKLIVDLLVERGLAGMRNAISDTAEWGGFVTGNRLVTDHTRAEMRRVLNEIQSGEFAQKWVRETSDGMPNLNRLRKEEAALPIESAGADVRKRLP